MNRFFCFFFQAEDGIRDYKVTGVQTCALPIWAKPGVEGFSSGRRAVSSGSNQRKSNQQSEKLDAEIGRASCRERV